MVWEFVFLMVIMKIPIVYLCAVVYWAIKAEPRPSEGARLRSAAPDVPPVFDSRAWPGRVRRPRRGPHGSPMRTAPRGRALRRATNRR